MKAARKTPRRGRKSWREKLAVNNGLPKVMALTGPQAAKWGGVSMVVPSPREVDALIRQVPAGRVATIAELRAALARRHGTEVACPITTGIFAWIAAHAAVEAAAAGEPAPTPWWRVLKTGGELNPKYPGGAPEQSRLLAAEGHRFKPPRGARPPRVADWEKVLHTEFL